MLLGNVCLDKFIFTIAQQSIILLGLSHRNKAKHASYCGEDERLRLNYFKVQPTQSAPLEAFPVLVGFSFDFCFPPSATAFVLGCDYKSFVPNIEPDILQEASEPIENQEAAKMSKAFPLHGEKLKGAAVT